MNISIVRPTAIAIVESGGATIRVKVGDIVEATQEWEVKRNKKMVELGLAIEVGGNAAPTETKKAPAKKRVTRKKAPAKAAEPKSED